MLNYKKIGFFYSQNNEIIQEFYAPIYENGGMKIKTRVPLKTQEIKLFDINSLNFDYFNLTTLKFKFNLNNINLNFEKLNAIVFLKNLDNPSLKDYEFYDIERFEIQSNNVATITCKLDIFNSYFFKKNKKKYLITQYCGNDDLIKNYFYTNLESFNKHQISHILAEKIPFLTSTINGNHYIYPIPTILLYRSTEDVDVDKVLFHSNCAIFALPITQKGISDALRLVKKWGRRFVKAIIHPFGPLGLDVDITSPSWGRKYVGVTGDWYGADADEDGIEILYINGEISKYKFNYILNWELFQKYKHELNEEIEYPAPKNEQLILESRTNCDSYWLHYGTGIELLKRPYLLQFDYTFNPTMKIYDEFEIKEVNVGINFSFPSNAWNEFLKNNPTYYEQKKIKNIESGVNFGLSLLNSTVGLAGSIASGNVAGALSGASSLIGSSVSFASQKKIEKLEIENKKNQYIFQNSDTFNTFSFMQDKIQDWNGDFYNLMLLVHNIEQPYDFPIINAFQKKDLSIFELMTFNYLKGECLSSLQKPYLDLVNQKMKNGVYIL